MSNQPLATIVTPSYNQAAFLEQTIRSVLEQDYPNLEYIVVDGGSQDGSQEIIRKYERHLKWWVSEPDSGQAEAINKGLGRAAGEIVAWLNSDDAYLPGAIAAAVRALQAEPRCGLVYGDVLAVDADGQALNTLRYADWGLEGLMRFRIIGQPAVFLRRAALQQAGQVDSSYHFLLDHQLWLRIAQIAPIRYVPQLWAAARYHPAAKNIAQAAGFGGEVYRILAWMQTQPALLQLFQKRRRQIWSGAHCLNARYLSEGGAAAAALAAYARGFWAYPPQAIQDWKRILYTLLMMAGLGGLAAHYRRLRRAATAS